MSIPVHPNSQFPLFEAYMWTFEAYVWREREEERVRLTGQNWDVQLCVCTATLEFGSFAPHVMPR